MVWGCGSADSADLFTGSSAGSAGAGVGGTSSAATGGGSGSGPDAGVGGAGGSGGSAGFAGTGVGGTGVGGTGFGGAGGSGLAGSGGFGVGGSGGTGADPGSGGTGVGGVGGAGTGGIASGGSAGVGGTGGSGGLGQPGVVVCGNTTCNIDSQVCCRGLQTTLCAPRLTGCGTSAAAYACDGPEDCPNSQRCCGELISLLGQRVFSQIRCADQCDGDNRRVICGAHPSSCPEGEECQPSSQAPGYFACVSS